MLRRTELISTYFTVNYLLTIIYQYFAASAYIFVISQCEKGAASSRGLEQHIGCYGEFMKAKCFHY